jgi:hypothetical protein
MYPCNTGGGGGGGMMMSMGGRGMGEYDFVLLSNEEH